MLSRKVIEELNALSKEVFNSTSKWRKMCEKGVLTPLEEDTVRLAADGTKTTVKTPVMHVGKNDGEIPRFYLKRYTPETVREFMVGVLLKRQQFMEAIKKQQADQKAAQATKDAVSEAAGSSV
jgi:hypothetical protein